VTDGDTLVVAVEGREEDVRLIGINTPERDECFFAEATNALADLVEDQTIGLVVDETDRDQYGRLLRYVFAGDTFVNEAMVRGGFAQAVRYEPDVARADELDAAQAEAEAAQRGLWAPDACGRVDADAGALVVERIEADPPGDDTLDANAEYAVVANRSDGEVDLTGWVLKDETASHRFAFPAGFTLAAGATVTVHTGCGSATATDLFWCNQGSAIWNNDGDTAFLLDPNGNVVATRSY
jgi:micrococcal nuclease